VTCALVCSASFAEKMRRTMPGPPPAGKGTMIRTGFAGYGWAMAVMDTLAASRAAAWVGARVTRHSSLVTEQLRSSLVHVVDDCGQARYAVLERSGDALDTELRAVRIHHEPQRRRASRHRDRAYRQHAVLLEHLHRHQARRLHRHERRLFPGSAALARDIEHVIARDRDAGTAQVSPLLPVLLHEHLDELLRELAGALDDGGIEVAQRIGDSHILSGLRPQTHPVRAGAAPGLELPRPHGT